MSNLNIEAERAAFEAWLGLNDRVGPKSEREGDSYTDHYVCELWEAWQAARRTAPSSAVAAHGSDEGLPPLPDHTLRFTSVFGKAGDPYYTARQMRQYALDALDAIAAYSAQQQACPISKATSLYCIELEQTAADLRAQLASAHQAKEYEQRHAAESEKALAQVQAQLARYKQWYDAVTDACVVSGELPWDENDARGSLARLIAWREEIALDPKVSERAAQLARKDDS
jgi:hypothetical protein